MAISTRVDDPAWRAVTFDQMVDSYYDQVDALVEAGVDILLPETFIDTLNLVDTPLAFLPIEKTRPPKSALDEIMESLR